MVEEWKKQTGLLEDKTLFVTVDKEVLMLTSTTCTTVDSLRSDHEEADTRMLLHAKHASLTCDKVMIYTPDTDVIITAMSMCSAIEANLFVMTGKGNARRIIDIALISNKANETINKTDCDKNTFLGALIGYHSFTGCDTTSCFAGRGKVRPLSIMASKERYMDVFASLGRGETVSVEHENILESFVCEMYGEKCRRDESLCVDDARYKIYCRKNGKLPYDSLPPCRNVLAQPHQEIKLSSEHMATPRASSQSSTLNAPHNNMVGAWKTDYSILYG